ncbi:hypothetical protein OG239_00210 [Streptomyces sp. NBC_00868]|uniref:hypothetical protein n=1 Tax=unclassified Streptomyces TaxID=2593676 RepID=UPI00324CD09B|nr:hypothetical protein OG239_00210 [Streptomyces sp. NBC_00868]
MSLVVQIVGFFVGVVAMAVFVMEMSRPRGALASYFLAAMAGAGLVLFPAEALTFAVRAFEGVQ